MGEVIGFPPDPDELVPERPEEFIGDKVDWVSLADNPEDEIEILQNNAIHLFWIGITQLLSTGYPTVPKLLRLIADEVEWQQKNGHGV